jgi:hypothetical protein
MTGSYGNIDIAHMREIMRRNQETYPKPPRAHAPASALTNVAPDRIGLETTAPVEPAPPLGKLARLSDALRPRRGAS